MNLCDFLNFFWPSGISRGYATDTVVKTRSDRRLYEMLRQAMLIFEILAPNKFIKAKYDRIWHDK